MTIAARWLLYSALSAALGGMAVQALLRRRMGVREAEEPRSWLLPAAVIGAVAAFALALLVLGDGSLARGVSGLSVSRLADTRPGTMALIAVDGFLLAALLAVTRHRTWAAVPLAAVALAEGLRGHVGTAQPGWGAALAAVHTLAAALWTGGLVQAVRTAWKWRAQPDRARRTIGEYARAALWLALITVGTGTAAALVLLTPHQLLSTGYGRFLLAKIALVALTLGLAVGARARLGRKADPERISVPAWAEAVALAAVLAVSAVLTGFSPPRDDGTTLTPAAPATAMDRRECPVGREYRRGCAGGPARSSGEPAAAPAVNLTEQELAGAEECRPGSCGRVRVQGRYRAP